MERRADTRIAHRKGHLLENMLQDFREIVFFNHYRCCLDGRFARGICYAQASFGHNTFVVESFTDEDRLLQRASMSFAYGFQCHRLALEIERSGIDPSDQPTPLLEAKAVDTYVVVE